MIALGLDVETKRSWQVSADGKLVRSNEVINDFALRNLAFQVHYRYEFMPLFYLCLAYVRGGSLFDAGAVPCSVGEVFGGALDLHDSDQRLLKLSYRFAI